MALSKKIIYPNGTETNYHKIHSVTLTHVSAITNTETGEEVVDISYNVEVQVYSYVSKEIRKINEHNYLRNYAVVEVRPAEEVENANIMALAYEIVKRDGRFADAEDV